MKRTLHLEADFGPGIGTGHVMRCLTLAEAWQRYEGETTLMASSPLTQRLAQLALEIGTTVVNRCRRVSADWVVLDSYRAGVARQQELAERSRLLVIDDHHHQLEYAADIVLDQNLDAQHYGYDSASMQCLLGPSFALLRDTFRHARSVPRQIGEVRRILITLGGDPPPQLVDQIQISVARIVPESQVDIAAGARTDMVELMVSADLAVAASGTTAWELCCMGVPSLLIPLVENQRPVAEALARHGAAIATSLATLEADLTTLIGDKPGRTQLASTAQELVDGRGASRVVAAMRARSLSVRGASIDDAQLLFDWANEADTRSQSFSSAPIVWEDHVRWLASSLADRRRSLAIVSDAGRPIGQVRVDLTDVAAVIAVSLDRAVRGNGLGPAVIRTGATWAREQLQWRGPLDAWIKPTNIASQRSFIVAGFTSVPGGTQSGSPALRYRDVNDG